MHGEHDLDTPRNGPFDTIRGTRAPPCTGADDPPGGSLPPHAWGGRAGCAQGPSTNPSDVTSAPSPVRRFAASEWLRSAEALQVAGLGALTLGLAPFTPEPHLVGKLRWVAGGGVGMNPVDYFDLALHGAPWLLLAGALAIRVADRLGRSPTGGAAD